MPAIPVMPRQHPQELRALLGQQGLFERGDRIYLQTPVQPFRPSTDQIEEYAFSKALKQNAPNENLAWFKGQYVEADNANGNGAMWRAEELSIKSLTPMLMPVTVMHDPSTAVGTIADVKLLTPEADKVPRTRIDTVLALWAHRFPEVVHEAEVNAADGTLMQSMECYSPVYSCSECGRVYHKLPQGAEQAQWCEHLKASNPSAGFVDLSASARSQRANASRILESVCFTGTGLIFGSRGAEGAFPDAYLSNFEDELARHHQSVHAATATTATPRSSHMGIVQIEDSELAILRKERDDARAEVATLKPKFEEATAAAEKAEAEKVKAEKERDDAKAEAEKKDEELARTALKDKRLGGLGEGFTAKLGDFTKTRLTEQAGRMSDDEWEDRLRELEEAHGKRDAAKDEKDDKTGGGKDEKGEKGENGNDDTFGRDELARLGFGNTGEPARTGEPSTTERASVVTSLAGAFKKPATAEKD